MNNSSVEKMSSEELIEGSETGSETIDICDWRGYDLEQVKDVFNNYLELDSSVFSEKKLEGILFDFETENSEKIEFIFEFLYLHFPECFSWKIFNGKTIIEYYFVSCQYLTTVGVHNEKHLEWAPKPCFLLLFMIKFTLKNFPNFFKENNIFNDYKKIEFKTISECMKLLLENS